MTRSGVGHPDRTAPSLSSLPKLGLPRVQPTPRRLWGVTRTMSGARRVCTRPLHREARRLMNAIVDAYFLGVGACGGARRTPRQPERVIACCTNPDALISSMNSLM